MEKIETVSIISQHSRILLGMKKVRFGKGKYNGFGGGLENGESLLESAIRETREEVGITMVNPLRMGELLFQFPTEEPDHRVHFFKAFRYKGSPTESDEMKPMWFYINNIPYDQMWSNDRYWLPLLLRGKFFTGHFQFDENHGVAEYELNEVTRLD